MAAELSKNQSRFFQLPRDEKKTTLRFLRETDACHRIDDLIKNFTSQLVVVFFICAAIRTEKTKHRFPVKMIAVRASIITLLFFSSASRRFHGEKIEVGHQRAY